MRKLDNVVFMSKLENIETLITEIKDTRPEFLGNKEEKVIVTKEKTFGNGEYQEVLSNLLTERDWITKDDSGQIDGRDKVIQVTNKDTGEYFFIRSEGYKYARYTGLSTDILKKLNCQVKSNAADNS